jgi:hypothetical protein
MRFTLENWERYSALPAPIFKTRKAAEKEAKILRSLRAWVNVIEVNA